MSLVEHSMTPDPDTIAEHASATQASQLMEKRGLRHLPVVDGDSRLVGMISDRDLRGPMIGGTGTVPASTTSVSAIMSRNVITVLLGDTLGVAARRMVEHRIGALPVVDPDGVLRGILSYVDILGRLVREAEMDARAIALMDRD